jgi:hypothetical protein
MLQEVGLALRIRSSALRLWFLLIVIAGVALFTSSSYAQVAGHYLGGITGLENGSDPPPGFYGAYLGYVNPVDELKGRNGNTILHPDITVAAQMAGYSMTTPLKFLGADYGFSVLIPVVNTRFTLDEFNASQQTAGISDTYFAPLVLGWTKGRANFLLNYGFYAPTGNFDPNKSMNPGLGFWEQQFQAGTTMNLDKRKLWNTSVLTTWEINQAKQGQVLRGGPMFTGEYSFGRRFDKYQMNAGVVGFAYTKLSADSGSGVNPLFAGVLDRAFGTGGEWKYTNIKWHMAFDARYEQQYGVEARTSGKIIVFSITYLKLFPPPTAHK